MISILVGVSLTTNHAIGATNITNNTVIARVNVTNTEPNITSVTVDDGNTIPANQVELTANGATTVTCNATVFDYNGWQDINPNRTNATFYINSVDLFSDPDNNHLYVNRSCGSCRQATTDEAAQGVTYTAICDCKFAVQYYANASSNWVCNMSVSDRGGTQKSDPAMINLTDRYGSTGTVTITSVLAINTSNLIDYGNLSVTQTSSEIVFNVTNVGNTDLNLSFRGYGGDNETIGENLSMVCDFGNITWDNHNQRYSFGLSGIAFADMSNLTNKTIRTNFSLPSRIDDSSFGIDRNSTFWRLNVPLGVGGICNGTIIIGAFQKY